MASFHCILVEDVCVIKGPDHWDMRLWCVGEVVLEASKVKIRVG